LLADLVTKLGDAGAAAIVFVAVFPEADRTAPKLVLDLWRNELRSSGKDLSEFEKMVNVATTELVDPDEKFANSLARRNVVLDFVIAGGGAKSPPQKAGYAVAGDDPIAYVPRFHGAITNLPALDSAAAGLGTADVIPDSDGITRRVPTFV